MREEEFPSSRKNAELQGCRDRIYAAIQHGSSLKGCLTIRRSESSQLIYQSVPIYDNWVHPHL
jgi:hypothetical protein